MSARLSSSADATTECSTYRSAVTVCDHLPVNVQGGRDDLEHAVGKRSPRRQRVLGRRGQPDLDHRDRLITDSQRGLEPRVWTCMGSFCKGFVELGLRVTTADVCHNRVAHFDLVRKMAARTSFGSSIQPPDAPTSCIADQAGATCAAHRRRTIGA
jgi:hypothetical protein